ncbi:MAG: Fic family protein [Alphaproteobacteria bacterium]|nr:Fic family protein [Alphaproteobacteria bacterium]
MDATLAHLTWTLAFDWSAVRVGEPHARPGDLERLVGWRRGRPDSAAFEALAPHPRPVSWAAMCEVQRVLCGADGFREGPAHCRDRTYGWREGLGARFARKVERDAAGHPVVRAIRLYLDVVHVHPFADGNTRAAVLWAGWILMEAGWPVPDMGAVVRIPKPPGDPRVVAAMVAVFGGTLPAGFG